MRAVPVEVSKDYDARSSCWAKQSWTSFDKVTHTLHGKKVSVRAYRCPHCRLWHAAGRRPK